MTLFWKRMLVISKKQKYRPGVETATNNKTAGKRGGWSRELKGAEHPGEGEMASEASEMPGQPPAWHITLIGI